MSDKKGYPSTGWFQIHREVMASASFRALDAHARCLLFEFMNFYNGHNNGFIEMSHRKAAELIGASRATADKAVAQLVEHGFICRTYKGRRISGTKKIASRWELTCYPTEDAAGKAAKPSNEYLNWKGKPVDFEGAQDIDKIHTGYRRPQRITFGMKKIGDAVAVDMDTPVPEYCGQPATYDQAKNYDIDEYDEIPF